MEEERVLNRKTPFYSLKILKEEIMKKVNKTKNFKTYRPIKIQY